MYCTVQEFEDNFGVQETLELSRLDTPSATTRLDSIIERAIERASWTADGYLAKYLPLTSPYPNLLKALVLDIARYFLYRYTVPEDVRKRYEDALKMLMNISNGTVSLGLVGTPPAVVSGGNPRWSSSDMELDDQALRWF